VSRWYRDRGTGKGLRGTCTFATCALPIPPFYSRYVDDGAWWEGPIYHGYASRYFVPFASGLLTATGSDAGLWEVPGAAAAAHYQSKVNGGGEVRGGGGGG
jgi:hypothetical protein